jgi:hypothetical protein
MERNACKSHLKLFDEIRAWISDRRRKQMSMEYKGNRWVRIFFYRGWMVTIFTGGGSGPPPIDSHER